MMQKAARTELLGKPDLPKKRDHFRRCSHNKSGLCCEHVLGPGLCLRGRFGSVAELAESAVCGIVSCKFTSIRMDLARVCLH